MGSDFWQVVLVDALFLCIAGGLGFWIRSLLQDEREAFDLRLAALEAQRDQLERLSERLQSLCLRLENQERGETGKSRVEERPPVGPGLPRAAEGTGREDQYGQAWKQLAQGVPVGEVARRLGLGIAEVELMSRILRHKNRP